MFVFYRTSSLLEAIDSRRAFIVALMVGLTPSCAGEKPRVRSPQAAGADWAEVDGQRPDEVSVGAAQQSPQVAPTERELAQQARLSTILRVARARNPELQEASARLRAASERAPASSRLPDPVLEYQLWAAPLTRPYAVDEAQMHMFTLSQSFPAPGTLGAREQAAEEQANVLRETRRGREQEVIARVRRAYAEYYRVEREYRLHLEHVELAQQVVDLARAGYQAGRGTQQDVLRSVVALSRLHNDLVVVERDRRSARGLLNTLMARPVDAPLGPPEPIQPRQVKLRLADLERRLLAARPDVAAAERAVRVRESELDGARKSGRWPSFMVGLSYMLMPPMEEPHNYGAMFSMTLPWLNPRYGEEVRAAEANVAAEQSALSGAKSAARYELYDAMARLESAGESFSIIERDFLPQARQSFESARALYRGAQGDSIGLLDAFRSLVEVRIERERALARLESALADVERAVGAPITSTGPTGSK